MSRLLAIGVAAQSWFGNNLRQINECFDQGCPHGGVTDLRKSLSYCLQSAEPGLTKTELDMLIKIELSESSDD